MTLLDRALRLGEGKQFKQYAKRVERINQWEPELELLEDDELREQADSLRERARNGESLDDLFRGEAVSEEGESLRAVARVGIGLCRHRAHSCAGPRDDGADGQELGLDGDS